MNDQRKQSILTIFANCPVVSTDQVAKLFTNAQPMKRASQRLCELAEEKLIEGYNRGLAGKTKVWRLTKKGRESMGVTRPPVPFGNRNLEHWLAITDAWQELSERGKLLRWVPELREPFAGKMKYCADSFFALRTASKTHIGVIEVQRSPLTTKRWAEKWAVATSFFDSPAFSNASFQDFKTRDGKPIILKPSQLKIIVVSNQQPDTIQAGSRLPLIICPDIKSAPLD